VPENSPFDPAPADDEVRPHNPFASAGDLPADIDDDVDELDDDETDDADTTPGAPQRRKVKTGLSKVVVRKIVAKTFEVETAPPATREMTAAALNVANDTTDLVAAIFTNSKNASAVFDDINEIVEADLMEVAIIAGALGRERMKSVWKLLTALGAASSALHTSDAKAGLAIAKATKSLTDQQTSALADASNLLTTR
jgi:hypothetical protein